MSRQSPVSSVMTTEVLTFSPEQPITEAMRTMVERDVDGAPVVDAAGRVVGMLSTGDLIVPESTIHFPLVIEILGATIELPSAKRTFDEDLRKALGSTVGDLMHGEPVTIEPTDTIEEAATLMHERKVSRLPVVDGSGLVGLISRGDVLRGVLLEDEADTGTEG